VGGIGIVIEQARQARQLDMGVGIAGDNVACGLYLLIGLRQTGAQCSGAGGLAASGFGQRLHSTQLHLFGTARKARNQQQQAGGHSDLDAGADQPRAIAGFPLLLAKTLQYNHPRIRVAPDFARLRVVDVVLLAEPGHDGAARGNEQIHTQLRIRAIAHAPARGRVAMAERAVGVDLKSNHRRQLALRRQRQRERLVQQQVFRQADGAAGIGGQCYLALKLTARVIDRRFAIALGENDFVEALAQR